MVKIHVFDFALLKEWLGTCQDFFKMVIKPGSNMPLKSIFAIKQDDWAKAFTEWCVLHFWWSLLVQISANMLLMVITGFDAVYMGSLITNLIIYTVLGYMWSHIGWFAVTKQEGCLCFWFICVTHGNILILIMGCFFWLYAAALIINSVTWLAVNALGFIYVIIYGTYAVPMFYMGLACFMTWKQDPNKGANEAETVVGDPTTIGKA
eukprot:TRINITY_DN76346_c0_g1_i1.p1 TRINITY_DN76346_c0_g1~~TRINITY_DN76346_c0_g1_i1.p1  ORF type:complete len:207 (+),score=44.56 TRINITY_DN76346_c0_g1_i1:101-721(+)